ncbi:MAG: PorV/PorQ family protein [Ignavibacteriae bacterium]|nr:MAG: PorV/PorQ family protein [Ignavibacteriota bacterium]
MKILSLSSSILRRSLLFFVFFAVFAVNIFAQGSGNKYAGEFLAIGVGGRPLGMGGAFVSLVNDVTAGYWNPGALARIKYPQLSVMHDERFGNLVNYDYGSVAIPFGPKVSLGFSVIRLGVDDVPKLDKSALIDLNNNGYLDPGERLDYSKITFFNAADYAFFFTYSKMQSEKFSYGVNLKVINRSIDDGSAWGIGFDVGAIYSPMTNFRIGANLQDVTTTYLAWNTGRKELITPTAKVGGSYDIEIFKTGRITPSVDFDVRFENRKFASLAHLGPVSFDVHGGIEYGFKDLFAIRAGYNDVKQFTFGAGIKLPKLNVDYSFAKFDRNDNDLGDTHRISVMFTLDDDKFKRKGE